MTYLPDLLAKPVPRYTSFPTAAEFHDGVGAAEQAEGLAAIRPFDPVSLYIHVPYCHEICHYCGCNTGRANGSGRLERYLGFLTSEIDLVARNLDGRGRILRVALGGGSPNALTPEQFDRLAARIIDAFGADRAIWSVEIDPRRFDQAFADSLAKAGAQHASLGVQTFDPEIQCAIGRIQSAETIALAVDRLRGAGVKSLNFDLMYGLPGQTAAILEDTLHQAVALHPDRLAVFGYAHVPHLVARQHRIDETLLPGPEQRFIHSQMARAYLQNEGYAAIGFDHFALPDDPLARAAANGLLRRNFQGYTDDPCQIMIGLGASSVSRHSNAFLQNEKNAGRYGTRVSNGVLPATRGIALSALNKVRGRVIEQWLCYGQTNIALLPDHETIRNRVSKFVNAGLCRFDGCRLILERDGWPYARAIAARFDPWRAVSPVKFSSAV